MSDGYSLTQAPGHPVPGHWTGPDADAAIARVFEACGNTGITARTRIATASLLRRAADRLAPDPRGLPVQ